MSSATRSASSGVPLSRFERFIARLLPWYDDDAEAEKERHGSEVIAKGIKARIRLEQVRSDYQRADGRLRR